MRTAERYLRIERDNAEIQQKVAAATNSLARTFDRIVRAADRTRLHRRARRRPEGDRRRHVCWRGSTARATCWSPSACATARGTVWIPPSWRRWCRRCCFESRGDTPGAPPGVDVADRPLAARAGPDPQAVDGHQRRRAAPPAAAEPRARPRFRRGDPPLGDHRRPGFGTGRLRRRGQRISVVRRGFRAVVPPGARPARPGPQCRPDAGACGPPRNAPSATFGAASWLLTQGSVWPTLRLQRTSTKERR